MRHVIVMSASASIGLLSIFLVDFLDLYFISLLGQRELAAAVGFAGTLLFIAFSVNIGLMIAMSALAAQRIGRGEDEEARRIATSIIALGAGTGAILGAVYFVYAPDLAELIGASGETRDLAARYMRFIAPTMPFAMTGMIASGILRAHGDARRAMVATMSAGIVNAIFDPILIFWAGLDLDGAALASGLARLAMFATSVYPVIRHYGGFAPFDLGHFRRDLAPVFGIAVPAILTNVATPIGTAFVTRAVAAFGDSAVAGYAVIGRVTPLFFAVIFALSGAVGPIVGQNFGARSYDRVRAAFTKSFQFTAAYTAAAWIALVLVNGYIADAFGLDETGADLLFWYAVVVAPLFFFNGALFVSNAAFNNLNRALWSTLLNWGRNTLGIIPFIWLGARWFDAPGVIIGQAVGGVGFAALGAWLSYRLVDAYEDGRADPEKGWKGPVFRARPWPPFTSPRG